MLDARMAAQLEQSCATLSEFMPPLWRGLYDGCIASGFTDAQSIELVKAYILSQSPYGVNGAK